MFQTAQQIGNYTLISKLGRGGFGEVWLAERRTKFVTTKVAVKLPLDDQVDHEAVKQEATLWEKASGHPNILPIIDADEYDGQIVIVSEYAPDGSLEQWLRTNGKMPVERAIETTIQILDGLDFLYSRDIIHRDLKPANILLQGKTPRLADFGISRALRTTVASQSQNISGTFAYMSPEALDGKRSKQTDIWSVGVNFYQFLTGTLPFPQTEPSQLLSAIMLREYTPLPVNIPPNLQTVIAKALAKQPENRYASASKMSEDLKRILRGEKVSKFVYFDLPETQHSLPVKHIPPTQRSPIVFNRSTHNEVKTVLRSKTKPTMPTFLQDDPHPKSNLWIFATIGLFLISAIGLGVYFMANTKQSVENKNEVSQVSSIPLSNNSTQLASEQNQSVLVSATPLSNISANTAIINTATNLDPNIIDPTPTPTPDKAQLQTIINKYVAGVNKGNDNSIQGSTKEYKDDRKIMFGDLDNDGDEDVAVSFLIIDKEYVSNWHNRYLAVFRNENGKFKAVTKEIIGYFSAGPGGQGELKYIKNGRVFVEDDDSISYTLRGNRLVKGK